ncbi:MAG: sensor protein ZraS, partial [Deltaproteobacteria bacterium]|nr:sensor protein ZraS [Deltaproteobacteria bacterium]
AIVSREPELLYDDVDLNELARHSLLEMGGSLNSSIVEKYEELPPVKADPDQIRKVIMNLLLNAEEATGGKGEIRLET